jgi:hypothetical protein
MPLDIEASGLGQQFLETYCKDQPHPTDSTFPSFVYNSING